MTTKTKKPKRRKTGKPAAVRRVSLTLTRDQWRSIVDDFKLAVRWCEREHRREDSVWLAELVKSIVEEIKMLHPDKGDSGRIAIERELDDWCRASNLVLSGEWRGVLWPRFQAMLSAANTEDW